MQLNSIKNCKKKKELMLTKNKELQLNQTKILKIKQIEKKKK